MAGDLSIPDTILDYLRVASLREPPVLRRLREETASHPRANMQISAEHAQFMAFLVELIRAERTIEIGVFTGYSALAVALALPPSGRVVACDVSEEYTSVARRYWKEAGVENRIDLRLMPAIETLHRMIETDERGRYDFAFIDADKENVDAYYEYCLRLLRPNGVVAIDNIFQNCKVLDPSNQEPGVVAMRRLSEKLRNDDRVIVSVLPFADGVTLALKK